MKVLSIRVCTVSPEAKALAGFFGALGMPPGTMLQIVDDDSDAFAAHARQNGLSPEGPMDAHGEHIYFLKAPGGLQVAFQSALAASQQ